MFNGLLRSKTFYVGIAGLLATFYSWGIGEIDHVIAVPAIFANSFVITLRHTIAKAINAVVNKE